MSYSRRVTQDGVTVMNKDLYDNLQDGIDELQEDTLEIWKANTLLGAKNFADPKDVYISNEGYYTIDDGSVYIRQNAPSNDFEVLCYNIPDSLLGKEVTLTGTPTNDGNHFYQRVYLNSQSTEYIDNGEGVTFQMPETRYSNRANFVAVTLNSGYGSGVTFYPMLRLSKDPVETFVPNALTNRELTERMRTKVDPLLDLVYNMNRRTRRNITDDLANLPTAVSAQNLAKYGFTIGDYFNGPSGYIYTLADMNTYKGASTPECITSKHLGIVVLSGSSDRIRWWSDSGDPNYRDSTLQWYLSGTVLNNIKSDFIALFGGSTGLEHLVSHSKLLTTALDNWSWVDNQYISALTCTQVDAGSQCIANEFQEGEACKSLELFRKYKWSEIIGDDMKGYWLRDLRNEGEACNITQMGVVFSRSVMDIPGAEWIALIIFH